MSAGKVKKSGRSRGEKLAIASLVGFCAIKFMANYPEIRSSVLAVLSDEPARPEFVVKAMSIHTNGGIAETFMPQAYRIAGADAWMQENGAITAAPDNFEEVMTGLYQTIADYRQAVPLGAGPIESELETSFATGMAEAEMGLWTVEALSQAASEVGSFTADLAQQTSALSDFALRHSLDERQVYNIAMYTAEKISNLKGESVEDHYDRMSVPKPAGFDPRAVKLVDMHLFNAELAMTAFAEAIESGPRLTPDADMTCEIETASFDL